MPKKKTSNIIEGSNDKEQNKSEKVVQETQKDKDAIFGSVANANMKFKVSELTSRIMRELYRHYGPKDSHVNKHLYYGVMFEVAILSGKPLNEVMDKWPKFDIFTILEKVKKVVEEELENNPTIMHQMVINSKMVSDRILAKAIYKNLS